MSRTGRVIAMHVAVSLVLLLALLAWADFRELTAAAVRTQAWPALGGLACYVVSTWMAARRVRHLFGTDRVTPRRAWRITLAGMYVNQLLPIGVGGDAYRLVRLQRGRSDMLPTASRLALERVVGIAVLVVPAVVCAAAERGGVIRSLASAAFVHGAAVAVVVASATLLAGIALFLARKAHSLWAWMSPIRNELRAVGTRTLMGTALWSLLFHTSRSLGLWCFLRAVGFDLGPLELIQAATLIHVASLIPLGAGALGVREGATVLVLHGYGTPVADGLLVAVLSRGALLLLSMAGAWVVVTDRPRARVRA